MQIVSNNFYLHSSSGTHRNSVLAAQDEVWENWNEQQCL